jgi:hypothetical protein
MLPSTKIFIKVHNIADDFATKKNIEFCKFFYEWTSTEPHDELNEPSPQPFEMSVRPTFNGAKCSINFIIVTVNFSELPFSQCYNI